MTTHRSGSRQPPGAFDDPDELRQEIDRTRQELGDTVEALAYKADIRPRVQERVTAMARDRRLQMATAATAGLALLVALALMWWRRRR